VDTVNFQNSILIRRFVRLAAAWVLVAAWLAAPRPCAGQAATNAATIVGGVARGFPGQSGGLSFSLAQTGTVSAVQFDLTWPTNRMSASTLQPGLLSNNVVVRSRTLASGRQRILAYTKNAVPLRTNQPVGLLPFSLPAGDFSGNARIVTVSSPLAARTNAQTATPVGLINGTVLLTPLFLDQNGVASLYLTVQSNQTYVVQASSNLVAWVNIATNFAVANYVVAADPGAVGQPMRFYRAIPASGSTGGSIGAVQALAGSLLTFNYPAQAGRSYVLQTSTNLALWQNVGTNLATGNLLGFTNQVSPANHQQFFRVLELP
jgi:hypothetical protein